MVKLEKEIEGYEELKKQAKEQGRRVSEGKFGRIARFVSPTKKKKSKK